LEVDRDGDVTRDLTSTFKTMKLVSIDKNGTLSVKKGAESYWNNMTKDLIFAVVATATDGTGASAEVDTFGIPLTKNMYMDSSYKSVTLRADSAGHAYFYCDQWNALRNDWNFAFTATSSNPNVVGVVDIYPDEDRNNWYEIVYYSGKYGTSASAKITIKAADGSNKSCSFTVKVTP